MVTDIPVSLQRATQQWELSYKEAGPQRMKFFYIISFAILNDIICMKSRIEKVTCMEKCLNCSQQFMEICLNCSQQFMEICLNCSQQFMEICLNYTQHHSTLLYVYYWHKSDLNSYKAHYTLPSWGSYVVYIVNILEEKCPCSGPHCIKSCIFCSS